MDPGQPLGSFILCLRSSKFLFTELICISNFQFTWCLSPWLPSPVWLARWMEGSPGSCPVFAPKRRTSSLLPDMFLSSSPDSLPSAHPWDMIPDMDQAAFWHQGLIPGLGFAVSPSIALFSLAALGRIPTHKPHLSNPPPVPNLLGPALELAPNVVVPPLGMKPRYLLIPVYTVHLVGWLVVFRAWNE